MSYFLILLHLKRFSEPRLGRIKKPLELCERTKGIYLYSNRAGLYRPLLFSHNNTANI